MAVATLDPRPDVQAVPVGLTPRGHAYLALARFRDIYETLGPDDRAYFAGELVALALDAAGLDVAMQAGKEGR